MKAPTALVSAVKTELSNSSYRKLSAKSGVSVATLKRVANGRTVSQGTVDRLRALGKARTSEDYPRKDLTVREPRRKTPSVAWPLSEVRAARDAQLRGNFRISSKLADAILLDDAIHVAYQNRVAPLNALPVRLMSSGGARGDRAKKLAQKHITTPRAVLTGIGGTIAMHNVAFGHITQETNDEGTLVSMRLEEWPIEHVRWDCTDWTYKTYVDGGVEVPIIHGDGEWIVFNRDAVDPFKKAALCPAALIFSAHLDAVRSWSAAANAHGQAKILGKLQEGVPTQDENGNLTPDADYLLGMLTDMVSGDIGAGLLPANTEAEFLTNGSSAWQVFSELAQNREKAAARVFLGTDGALGSQGGAPGVDVAELFGVATTKTQGDVALVQDGLHSGLYVPFTAINLGDSRYAPRLEFEMPDVDADQRVQQRADARDAMFDAIKAYKENGLELNQEVVDEIAKDYNLPAPKLAGLSNQVSIALAPTDVAKVVRVREARASQGLAPFGDERDDLTIAQLEAQSEAESEAEGGISNDAPARPDSA